MTRRRRIFTPLLTVLLGLSCICVLGNSEPLSLSVMLVPSDGGTEDGTREDWQPLFDALSAHTGYRFDIRVGQSYSAVVEAISAGRIDIAYMGTVAYLNASARGSVEVLAIGEMDGGAFYYSGLFSRMDGPVRQLMDLPGHTLALTDPSSSSGFIYPLNVLMAAGIDPVGDLGHLMLTGSHTNSLGALMQGHVDVAAAPFESYIRSVRQGSVDPRKVRILARSDPIPNPPLVVSQAVAPDVRERLRRTLHELHTLPGVTPAMMRGHAGRLVERYNAEVPDAVFDLARLNMSRIDASLTDALIRKASQRRRP
jgi:phosphonate transport system substrate-binding protein